MTLHFALTQWSSNHLHSDSQVLFRLVEEDSTGYLVFCGLMFASWLSMVTSSFNIDHFELFGVKQAVFGIVSTKKEQDIDPCGGWSYTFVRHPMMTGFLGVLVLSPLCITTYDRLLFSAINMVYITVGVHLEERDLKEQFG